MQSQGYSQLRRHTHAQANTPTYAQKSINSFGQRNLYKDSNKANNLENRTTVSIMRLYNMGSNW